jgi:ketosteroid isomerase-like protein
MTPVETALLFRDRINQRDPDKLADLMTEDHVFIDSLARTVRGREAMRNILAKSE